MLSVVFINALIVALSVLVHYEFLHQATKYLPKFNIKHRPRILVVVFITLIAHVIEVWIFGIAYYWMHGSELWGELQGNYGGTLLDSVYFSLTSFSTLGFGDIQPIGNIRFLVGMEGLTGFVLITWSASFLYYEMQRHWGKH